MKNTVPQSAKVVIIGGGVIGCSLAYHLGEMGWKDVVLLERKQLTCGTTWHAAGLIAQLRPSQNMTKLAKYTQELYWSLGDKTGVVTGFRRSGSLNVALTESRLEELKRQAAMARAFGVEVHELSPDGVKSHYPHLNCDDVTGGVYLPTDGQGDPANIALALAKGAKNFGVKIIENVKVTAITQKKGRVEAITWQDGDGNDGKIDCEFIANCAGMWGREIGKMANVNVPLHACEHFYIVTEQIPELGKLPVMRVMDEYAYYKEDAGKILLGAFEPHAKPWGMNGISDDFCFDQLPEDFDHFEPILEKAIHRMPILAHAGIHTFFNGPESFTPDDRYLLGEAPELKNFFVACGFNSIGIQSAGGAGMVLAQWMQNGTPPFDLWDVDIRRMQPFQNNKKYLYNRATEALGLLYADHFPYRQFDTARGIRRSPIHHILQQHNACFGEVAGWERANWFAPKNVKPEYEYSWKRQNWFHYAAQEHHQIRHHVGIFDMSSFGKIKICGRDARAVLQKICGNDISDDIGKITYTQFLNHHGGIEADLTVNKIHDDEYMLITPAATVHRDLSWIKRHMPDNAHCVALDVTQSEAALAIMGPKSRDFLQPLVDVSLDNDYFPFGTIKHVDIAMATARMHRVSYVGELGWEIYVPSDMAAYVFEEILYHSQQYWQDTPLKLVGMHVMDSCRIEKAFRHFGHDITDEDHVLESGLGFAVKTEKEKLAFGDFIGRDAVLRKKENGLDKRMLQFLCHDSSPMIYHNETIYRNGDIVSYVTSGNYGHHLGASVAMGYVPLEEGEKIADLLQSHYQIDIAGVKYDVKPSLKPLYDPDNNYTKL